MEGAEGADTVGGTPDPLLPPGASSCLTLEEPVLRPGQAQVLAQRPAFIFPTENPALLQLRHNLVDEVVQTFRQERKHDVEAVAGKLN